LGLGGLWIYPNEIGYISLEVISPDPDLNKANPRLKIVGKHDESIYGHWGVLRLIRDGGLLLCLLFLLLIGLKVLKSS
jgi:hypothetical protein